MSDGHATVFCLDLCLFFCQPTPAFVYYYYYYLFISGFGLDIIADLIWLD